MDFDNMLENIDKKHPFLTPDRYFEELPSKIQKRVSAEMEHASWALESANKELPFLMPDRYFEELPLRIQQKVSQETASTSWALGWWWKLGIPSALVLVLIFVILFFPFRKNYESKVDKLLADVSVKDMELYLSMTDYSNYDLHLSVEDERLLENMDFEFNILNDTELESISQEELLMEFDMNEINVN